jgi:cytochrome b subunit of formate dehydrogenase
MPVMPQESEVQRPPVHDQLLAMPPSPQQLEFVRFRPLHRALHVCMVISFITLALTGLSLKFSYTGWASRLSHLLGGFQTAGFIHRSAAFLMFTAFVVHIGDLFRLKRRQYGSWRRLLFGPDTMLFTRQDFREFVATMKWFVGAGPRPRYGRWTYWEKFDYFAVFWGVFVIGATGLMLWFPILFTRLLPGWLINVATIIHSDEALLATGFIFTIHFFNTHLRPEKFPMDTTVFSGHMPLAELKRDKPREYEQLVASGELQQHLAAPHPPIVVKTIRVFAWAALGMGFGIVVWIIYAMIFAYR